MTTPNNYIDSLIRHQVYLERLKTHEVNDTVYLLNQLHASLKGRLLGGEISELNKHRFNALLAGVNKDLADIFNSQYDDLVTRLNEIAVYEAEFQAKALENISAPDFESVIPSPDQLKAAVFTSIMSVRGATGGKLLEPFVKDWHKSEIKAYQGILRRGFAEGQTNAQLTREVSEQFKTTKRHANSMVRTGIHHTAVQAQKRFYESNALDKYELLVTLDGRTSPICRNLPPNKEYEYGKGVTPPLHIACRTMMIPVLPDEWKFLQEGETRSSATGYVSGKESYYSWLKKQPVNFQNDAIGETRARLLRKGGLSAEKFAALNMNRNFRQLTLEEMKQKEPRAFERAGIE